MHKVRDNYTAEIIILVLIAIMFLSSCGTIWQIDMVATCPAYATVECENCDELN